MRVCDTGRGITPEQLPHIFTLFFPTPVPDSEQGLRLGMGLARRIVELHGGRIDVYSAGNEHGSVFTIILPLDRPREAPTEGDAPP